MDIALIGGHGKVALLAAPLLVEAGHTVHSVIRNPEHADEVEATGARAVLADIETLDERGWDELLRGKDAVVWTAGAGGGAPERTRAVDHDAAVASMDAAERVGAAMGSGFLRVLREHPTGNYNSQVELVSGEIAYDVAHYLRQSEQRPSAVFLGVLGRPEVAGEGGESAGPGVAAAGGLIVEILPDADPELIDRLESNLQAIPGISWLMEQGGIDQVLTTALEGFAIDTREESPLYYRCRCTRDRLRRHLEMMSADDLDYLREETGDLEAECVFCGDVYRFDTQEIDQATGTPQPADA